MWNHPHLHLGDIVGVCSLEPPRSLSSTCDIGRTTLIHQHPRRHRRPVLGLHGGLLRHEISSRFGVYVSSLFALFSISQSFGPGGCSTVERSLMQSTGISAHFSQDTYCRRPISLDIEIRPFKVSKESEMYCCQASLCKLERVAFSGKVEHWMSETMISAFEHAY